MGKAVVTLAQRIQKRYKKNPEIMGVNPLMALVETMLPLYAEDARDIVARILQLANEKEEEVHIEDGFELYRELVEIRSIHSDVLPGVVFAFHIEGSWQTSSGAGFAQQNRALLSGLRGQ